MSFHEYPYTNFHEMNLDWVVKKVKELAAAWAQVQQDWTDEQAAFANLQSWIENYFNNLDVQTEINVKLDAMVAAGTMSELIAPYVASGLPAEVAEQIGDVVAAQIGPVVAAQISAVVADQLPAVAAAAAAQEVTAWLALHVNPETGYVIDDTFTVQGAAADAKAVGDEFTAIKSALSDYEGKQFSVTMTNGIYIKYDGTEKSQASSSASNFIEVIPNSTIFVSNLYLSGDRSIVFYDENQAFLSLPTFESTDTELTLKVPPKAKYVRGTAQLNESISINYVANDNIEDLVKTTNQNSDDIKDNYYVSQYIGKSLIADALYIYSYFELGNLSITTDPDTHWTYSDAVNNVRTKEGITIRLYKGDKVGFTSYSNGEHFGVGWCRTVDSLYQRDVGRTSDFTVNFEGDYVFTLYQSPRVNYDDAYDLLKNFFIKRGANTVYPFRGANTYKLKGIGHRGYTSEGAPENTIWSFRAAKTKGFHYVETDVAWTSDGVAVLLHDDTINRTGRNADGTEISGTVNIADITYAEALEYDFGIWKGSQYAGTKIMTVEELLVFCRATNIRPYFELKSDNNISEAHLLSFIQLIKTYGMEYDCTYISFSYTWLNNVLNIDNSLRIGLVNSGSFTDTIKTYLKLLLTNSNEVVYIPYPSYVSSDVVTFCKSYDIVLAIAQTNDLQVMLNCDDYVTECTSEVYVFDKVIEDKEMGVS